MNIDEKRDVMEIPNTECPVVFFGSVDIASDGTARSALPSWYNLTLVDQLKDRISDLEHRLNNPNTPANSRGHIELELREERKRLEAVRESVPRLDGKQTDWLAKVGAELEEEIRASMPTYSDTMRGTVEAHQELRIQKTPCIKIDPALAAAARIPVNKNGLASRDGAILAWKLCNRVLDKPTNVETLREM